MAAFLPRLFTRQATLKSARVVPSLSARPYAQRVEHKQDEDDAMEDDEDDNGMEDYGDPEKISGIQLTPNDYEDILSDDYEDDDTVTLGHIQLQRQRETLHYLRLIEHEMPKLVGALTTLSSRRPFLTVFLYSIPKTLHPTHARNTSRRPVYLIWRRTTSCYR